MEVLTRTFEEELREKMIQAKKECKYNPTRFNQMLAQYGGVETARRLIASAQKNGEFIRRAIYTVVLRALGLINGRIGMQAGVRGTFF